MRKIGQDAGLELSEIKSTINNSNLSSQQREEGREGGPSQHALAQKSDEDVLSKSKQGQDQEMVSEGHQANMDLGD